MEHFQQILPKRIQIISVFALLKCYGPTAAYRLAALLRPMRNALTRSRFHQMKQSRSSEIQRGEEITAKKDQ